MAKSRRAALIGGGRKARWRLRHRKRKELQEGYFIVITNMGTREARNKVVPAKCVPAAVDLSLAAGCGARLAKPICKAQVLLPHSAALGCSVKQERRRRPSHRSKSLQQGKKSLNKRLNDIDNKSNDPALIRQQC